MHRFMNKVKQTEEAEEEVIIEQKKGKIKYLTVFEYFLLVAMIGLNFYFVTWSWSIYLGFVFICLQVMKVVTWLTIREKVKCDICHKNILGEENEEK